MAQRLSLALTVATFAEAEKLVQAPLSAKDQTEVASD